MAEATVTYVNWKEGEKKKAEPGALFYLADILNIPIPGHSISGHSISDNAEKLFWRVEVESQDI